MATAHLPVAAAGGTDSRLRPPSSLACDRNQLTSHTGVLRSYVRGETVTEIGIHTDDDTDESVSVPSKGAFSTPAFLANGKPFVAADLARLESAPGVAREGLRLTAWVCLDGRTPPVIDWQFGD